MMLLNPMCLLKPTVAVFIVNVPTVAEALIRRSLNLRGPSTLPVFLFLSFV